jgi:hypothetical protein
MFGSWLASGGLAATDPGAFLLLAFGFVVAAPMLVVVVAGSMWMPAAVSVLISEAFAIRTWIYHAASGALCAFVGWQRMANFDESSVPLNEPRYVIAAGLAGGFAYWAVAGWNAGFWRPVFRRPPPAQPSQGAPFDPPVPTGA